jgi:catechol 2,3-dioxygenase-like lactoylglutathione lyase family enzyme
VNVRRLDHLNLLAADVSALRQFFEDVLGMRVTEKIVLDSGQEAGVWVTATNKSYDVAFTADHYGARGRFHHVTYALDSREEVLRAADIFLENGVHIETGPHKHAIQQTFFLYVYEPSGIRVEVANAGARLILAPDWQPVVWTEPNGRRAGVGAQDDRELPHARIAADRGVHGTENEMSCIRVQALGLGLRSWHACVIAGIVCFAMSTTRPGRKAARASTVRGFSTRTSPASNRWRRGRPAAWSPLR